MNGSEFIPLSPKEVFLGTFGGRVTINRSDQACTVATDCVAWVNDGETTVNIENGFNNLTAHLVIHEIFHILDLTVLNGAANQAVAAIQSSGVGFPNRPNLDGDSTGTWGFAGPNFSDWQKSRSGLSGEEFADMGIGWTYNQWETSRAGGWSNSGQARANFMKDQMAYWLSVALHQ